MGAAIILIVVLAAAFVHVVAPYDPTDVGVGPALEGPSREHLMGTDTFGRDIFSRVLYGARLSMTASERRT